MARIDYFDIEQAVAQHLRNDPELNGVQVLVEEEAVMEEGPTVVIALVRRGSPAELQGISANTRTRQLLNFELWCFHFALEMKQAKQLRDDLVGKVEISLLKNPSLGGKVTQLFLTGGDFDNVITENDSFRSGASIEVTIDVTGTT